MAETTRQRVFEEEYEDGSRVTRNEDGEVVADRPPPEDDRQDALVITDDRQTTTTEGEADARVSQEEADEEGRAETTGDEAAAGEEADEEAGEEADVAADEEPEAPREAWRTRETTGTAGKVGYATWPGSDEQTRFRWLLTEAGNLYASNRADLSRQPATDYPAPMQGRDYENDPAARAAVIDHTNKFNTAKALDLGSSVAVGPPTIGPGGIAIAGNERTMVLQRIYEEAAGTEIEYRAGLEAVLPDAGFDNPLELLQQFEQPVLVRQLDDANVDLTDIDTLRQLNDASDASVGKQKDAATLAATYAKRLRDRPDLLNALADNINPGQTIPQFLNTEDGEDYWTELVRSGVMKTEDLGRFVHPSGVPNEEGRKLLADAVFTTAIGGYRPMRQMPDKMAEALNASWPTVLAVSRLGPEYDMAPTLRAASVAWQVNSGNPTAQGEEGKLSLGGLGALVHQEGLGLGEDPMDPAGAQLAWFIANAVRSKNKKAIRSAFAEWQNHSQQMSLLEASPEETLRELFGITYPLTTEDAYPAEWDTAPAAGEGTAAEDDTDTGEEEGGEPEGGTPAPAPEAPPPAAPAPEPVTEAVTETPPDDVTPTEPPPSPVKEEVTEPVTEEAVADFAPSVEVEEQATSEPVVTPEGEPPPSRSDYQSERQYRRELAFIYPAARGTGEAADPEGPEVVADPAEASSRTMPQTARVPSVGSWFIDDTALQDGHEISQVVELDVNDIEVSENTDVTRWPDVERYAGWLDAGMEAPPITVVQTSRGTFKVTDGHRRLLAAKLAVQPTIKGIVSWSTRSDREGNPVVGLTFELAQKGHKPLATKRAKPGDTISPDDDRRLARRSTGLLVSAPDAEGRSAVRFDGALAGMVVPDQDAGGGVLFVSQPGSPLEGVGDVSGTRGAVELVLRKAAEPVAEPEPEAAAPTIADGPVARLEYSSRGRYIVVDGVGYIGNLDLNLNSQHEYTFRTPDATEATIWFADPPSGTREQIRDAVQARIDQRIAVAASLGITDPVKALNATKDLIKTIKIGKVETIQAGVLSEIPVTFDGREVYSVRRDRGDPDMPDAFRNRGETVWLGEHGGGSEPIVLDETSDSWGTKPAAVKKALRTKLAEAIQSHAYTVEPTPETAAEPAPEPEPATDTPPLADIVVPAGSEVIGGARRPADSIRIPVSRLERAREAVSGQDLTDLDDGIAKAMDATASEGARRSAARHVQEMLQIIEQRPAEQAGAEFTTDPEQFVRMASGKIMLWGPRGTIATEKTAVRLAIEQNTFGEWFKTSPRGRKTFRVTRTGEREFKVESRYKERDWGGEMRDRQSTSRLRAETRAAMPAEAAEDAEPEAAPAEAEAPTVATVADAKKRITTSKVRFLGGDMGVSGGRGSPADRGYDREFDVFVDGENVMQVSYPADGSTYYSRSADFSAIGGPPDVGDFDADWSPDASPAKREVTNAVAEWLVANPNVRKAEAATAEDDRKVQRDHGGWSEIAQPETAPENLTFGKMERQGSGTLAYDRVDVSMPRTDAGFLMRQEKGLNWTVPPMFRSFMEAAGGTQAPAGGWTSLNDAKAGIRQWWSEAGRDYANRTLRALDVKARITSGAPVQAGRKGAGSFDVMVDGNIVGRVERNRDGRLILDMVDLSAVGGPANVALGISAYNATVVGHHATTEIAKALVGLRQATGQLSEREAALARRLDALERLYKENPGWPVESYAAVKQLSRALKAGDTAGALDGLKREVERREREAQTHLETASQPETVEPRTDAKHFAATPSKLRDGTWGARVMHEAVESEVPGEGLLDTIGPKVGDTVTITTRRGKTWDAVVSKVVERKTKPSAHSVVRTQRPPKKSPPPETPETAPERAEGETGADTRPGAGTSQGAPEALAWRATVGPTLPESLAGAKPRYGYRGGNYTIAFASDTDRALYITAQKKKSKRDAEYRDWLRKVIGYTDEQIELWGRGVREQIKIAAVKRWAHDQNEGEIALGRVASLPGQYGGPTQVREGAAAVSARNMLARAKAVRFAGAHESVLLPSGAPKTLYHGSPRRFDLFDMASLGGHTGARSARVGFFFTDSPEVASRYQEGYGGERTEGLQISALETAGQLAQVALKASGHERAYVKLHPDSNEADAARALEELESTVGRVVGRLLRDGLFIPEAFSDFANSRSSENLFGAVQDLETGTYFPASLLINVKHGIRNIQATLHEAENLERIFNNARRERSLRVINEENVSGAAFEALNLLNTAGFAQEEQLFDIARNLNAFENDLALSDNEVASVHYRSVEARIAIANERLVLSESDIPTLMRVGDAWGALVGTVVNPDQLQDIIADLIAVFEASRGGSLANVHLAIHNPLEIQGDEQGRIAGGIFGSLVNWAQGEGVDVEGWRSDAPDRIRQALMERGYDGVVFRNIADPGPISDHFVVLDADHIIGAETGIQRRVREGREHDRLTYGGRRQRQQAVTRVVEDAYDMAETSGAVTVTRTGVSRAWNAIVDEIKSIGTDPMAGRALGGTITDPEAAARARKGERALHHGVVGGFLGGAVASTAGLAAVAAIPVAIGAFAVGAVAGVATGPLTRTVVRSGKSATALAGTLIASRRRRSRIRMEIRADRELLGEEAARLPQKERDRLYRERAERLRAEEAEAVAFAREIIDELDDVAPLASLSENDRKALVGEVIRGWRTDTAFDTGSLDEGALEEAFAALERARDERLAEEARIHVRDRNRERARQLAEVEQGERDAKDVAEALDEADAERLARERKEELDGRDPDSEAVSDASARVMETFLQSDLFGEGQEITYIPASHTDPAIRLGIVEGVAVPEHAWINPVGMRLDTPDRIYRFLRQFARSKDREILHYLLRDNDGNVLAWAPLTSGAIDYVDVSDPVVAKIDRMIDETGAASVMIVHNHPSGIAVPTLEDQAFQLDQLIRLNRPGRRVDVRSMVIDSDHFSYFTGMGPSTMVRLLDLPTEPALQKLMDTEEWQQQALLESEHQTGNLVLVLDAVQQHVTTLAIPEGTEVTREWLVDTAATYRGKGMVIAAPNGDEAARLRRQVEGIGMADPDFSVPGSVIDVFDLTNPEPAYLETTVSAAEQEAYSDREGLLLFDVVEASRLAADIGTEPWTLREGPADYDAETDNRLEGLHSEMYRDGRPRMWLHGSPSKFGRFDESKLGENTGAGMGQAYGFFFTDSEAIADDYKGNYTVDITDGGTDAEVFLALKNPKVLDYSGDKDTWRLGDDIEQAHAEGHDGVVVKDLQDFIGRSDFAVPFSTAAIIGAHTGGRARVREGVRKTAEKEDKPKGMEYGDITARDSRAKQTGRLELGLGIMSHARLRAKNAKELTGELRQFVYDATSQAMVPHKPIATLQLILQTKNLGELRTRIAQSEQLLYNQLKINTIADIKDALRKAKVWRMTSQSRNRLRPFLEGLDLRKVTDSRTRQVLDNGGDRRLLDLHLDDLRELVEVVAAETAADREAKGEIAKARAKRRKKDVKAISADIRKKKKLPRRTGHTLLHRLLIGQAPSGGVRRKTELGYFLTQVDVRPHVIMRRMTPRLNDVIEDPLMDGMRRQLAWSQEWNDAFAASLAKAAGWKGVSPLRNRFNLLLGKADFDTSRMLWNWLVEPVRFQNGGETVTMQRGEALWIVGSALDPTNKEILHRSGFDIESRNEHVVFAEDGHQNLVGALSKEELAAIHTAYRLFNGNMKQTLAKEEKAAKGYNIFTVPMYWPRKVSFEHTSDDADPLLEYAVDGEPGLYTWGHAKQRQGTNKPLKAVNIWSAFQNHTHRASQRAAYIGPAGYALSVLGDIRVKRAILDHAGPGALDAIRTAIRLQVAPARQEGSKARMARSVLGNIQQSLLSARIQTALLQPASLFIAANLRGDTGDWKRLTKAVGRWTADPRVAIADHREALNMSPFYRQRFESVANFIDELSSGAVGTDRFVRLPEAANRVQMLMLMTLDGANSALRWTWAKIHAEEKHPELVKNRETDPEAYQKAVDMEWWRLTRGSENTSNGMDLTKPLQVAKENVAWASMVPMRSAQSKQYSLFLDGLFDLFEGDTAVGAKKVAGGAARKLMAGAIASGMVVGGVRAMLRLEWDDDDWEWWESGFKQWFRRSATELASGPTIVGEAVLRPIIESTFGEGAGYSLSDLSLFAEPIEHAAQMGSAAVRALEAFSADERAPGGAPRSTRELAAAADRGLSAFANMYGIGYGGMKDLRDRATRDDPPSLRTLLAEDAATTDRRQQARFRLQGSVGDEDYGQARRDLIELKAALEARDESLTATYVLGVIRSPYSYLTKYERGKPARLDQPMERLERIDAELAVRDELLATAQQVIALNRDLVSASGSGRRRRRTRTQRTRSTRQRGSR